MGERPPEWTRRRPATTVCPTARISAPPRERDPARRKPGGRPPSQWVGSVRVTVEQAAALQGFGPGYPWQGTRTRCFLQIGNAVCPPVARRVLAAAMRHGDGDSGTRR